MYWFSPLRAYLDERREPATEDLIAALRGAEPLSATHLVLVAPLVDPRNHMSGHDLDALAFINPAD